MTFSYLEAGIFSGIIPTIMFYPIDQIKNQVASGLKPSFAIKSKALKYDLFSCIVSSGIYWESYNLSRDYNNPQISSMIGVTISTIFDTPLDYYKRKYQINSTKEFPKIRYFGYGIMSSYIYNIVWITYMTNKESTNFTQLAMASTLASLSTYTIDIKRTQLLTEYNKFSVSGLVSYLIYKVSYSTIYMSIFFYLTQKGLK